MTLSNYTLKVLKKHLDELSKVCNYYKVIIPIDEKDLNTLIEQGLDESYEFYEYRLETLQELKESYRLTIEEREAILYDLRDEIIPND